MDLFDCENKKGTVAYFGVYSGAYLTIGGEGGRKGHTKAASISSATTRHADLPSIDSNNDSTLTLRARLV